MKLFRSKMTVRFLKSGAAIAISSIVLLAVLAGWIQQWLWMRQLNYAEIFWELWSVRWEMFIVVFAAAFFYVWANLRMVRSSIVIHGGEPDNSYVIEDGARPLTFRNLGGAVIVVAALIGLIFASIFYAQWDTWIRFRYGGGFGFSEPVFARDVGFYVFRLPFYQLVQNGLTGLALVTFLAALAAYGIRAPVMARLHRFSIAPGKAVSHLTVLFLVLIGSCVWGFYLDRFQLLYSTRGVVYGVGFTASHVTLLGLWIMIAASLVFGAVLLWNLSRPRLRTIAIVGIGYLAAYWTLIHLIPALVQQFTVQPNELALERPYLKNNIELTRRAYGLDRIRETPYSGLADLTPEAISRNEDTIQNVRLWDSRPLLQTYRQTQEIRLYYQFNNVDVDRYHLRDGYHQVMLSTRELSASLPEKAQTWVNKYLQFTHGYGIVMSFVSKTIGEGFPQYILENIPPESDYGLEINQPSIYYGESTSGYRIVATQVKEFDYPKGDQNVYTSYRGTGGIPLDSLWKRVLFAWTQSDINIFLTSYLAPDSRIQIWRNVKERVAHLAPFLQLDANPYAVLSAGRLYWIQDAYTTSVGFPYSTPHTDSAGATVNYIRNSVKVVVDMYDGSVQFYSMDPADPILAAYRRAFPSVFQDLSRLPQGLKEHLRYPEDLFSVQANMYRSFHMTDPQVFYNQEDLWAQANQKYAGNAVPMQPYYILMKLPGSSRLEYLLMSPFTPPQRDNMIAWLAAECDFPDYGQMLVYRLPKEKLVYGPMQIEAMIDQNTTISEQLTLWDQKGSRVFRGNLIAIPIENSFLYIEPVYLIAEGADIPQLKRVIVVSGDTVMMEPSLEGAINAVFHTAPSPVTVSPPPGQERDLENARRLFGEAQNAMHNADWQGLGNAMEALKHILSPVGP